MLSSLLNKIKPAQKADSNATEALKSIKRDALPSFTFFDRPQKSSKELDQLEEDWWNKNGELIEQIWGLKEDICKMYRNDYAQKAKQFFLADKSSASVLDLGCGTGWFGRLIADDQLKYTGVDFSETQIAIAKREQKDASNSSNLDYHCVTDYKEVPDYQNKDGIIINAFLHHLYWDELNGLFENLRKDFQSGSKIFLMEPVYMDNREKVTNTDQLLTEQLATSIRNTIYALKQELISKNKYDSETEEKVTKLIQESSRNGFYLSPKEVPFLLSDFIDFLSVYCTSIKHYPVGVTNIDLAQFLTLITDQEERKNLTAQLSPVSKQIDELINQIGVASINPKTYVFTCFECTLK